MIDLPPPPPAPIPPPGWTPVKVRRWPKRVGIGVAIWLGATLIAMPFVDETPDDPPATTTTTTP